MMSKGTISNISTLFSSFISQSFFTITHKYDFISLNRLPFFKLEQIKYLSAFAGLEAFGFKIATKKKVIKKYLKHLYFYTFFKTSVYQIDKTNTEGCDDIEQFSNKVSMRPYYFQSNQTLAYVYVFR